MKHLLNSVFIILLSSFPLFLTLACPIPLNPLYTWFYTWVIKLIPNKALVTLPSSSKTFIVLCLLQYKIQAPYGAQGLVPSDPT